MLIRIATPRPRGSALVLGFALMVLLAALETAYATRMTSNQLRSESDIAGVRAYELAQSRNTLKIQEVWADFKQQPTNQRIAWVGGEDFNKNGKLDSGEDVISNNKLDAAHAPSYQDSAWVSDTAGDCCTRIKVLSLFRHDWALVRFTTWARVADEMKGRTTTRKVQRVVRFELGPASAFDYAYFANNHASLSGKKLAVYGSVGSNGDLDLSDNPLIDGNIFAASNPDLGALGVVNGTATSDNLNLYRSLGTANPWMRPTSPTAAAEDKNSNGKLDPGEDLNSNGKLDTHQYVLGYDGKQAIKTMQNQEVMPDFATLDYYRDQAETFVRPARPDLGEPGGTSGGIVKQLKAPGLDPTNPANYNILIDGSFGYNGENTTVSNYDGTTVTQTVYTNKLNSAAGATDNGNVSLIGTAAQPFVIFGPIIVSNDLMIKGDITGQGTFYTGRNAHVVGDLVYKNPPRWNQDDANFEATATQNRKADIVGFGIGGNVVFGDYTNADTNADQWSTVKNMSKPPYTGKEYLGNAQTRGLSIPALLSWLLGTLDGKNGYNNLLGYFDGNYLALDGGRIYTTSGSVPLLPNRNFLQSVFPKAYVHDIAETPQTVNGVFFTQHFFGGRMKNLKLFGAMIARDEAILSDNGGTFVYDPRISKQDPLTYINLFLPRTSALNVISFTELNADDAAAVSPDW